ncbi:MAG: hypothetical protein GTN69_07005 [Armatimonadetes bacterium]|nr:hypothetical protein [Armatimonadota bacterium]
MYVTTEMTATELSARAAEVGLAEFEELDLYDICYGGCGCCCSNSTGGYSC